MDPDTNQVPAGRVSDRSSSSPVVLPDGGVLYGAFTSYTPLSISSNGLIYAQNNGRLFAVGNPFRPFPFRPGRIETPRAVGPR